MFCLITSSKLFHQEFEFHWRWRWWDQIQTIFSNLFYFIKHFSDKIFQKQPLWTARETREPCARSALYTAALSMQCDQLVARGVFFQNETSLKITTHIEGGWVVLKMVAIFLLSESYIWRNTNAYCYGIEAGMYVIHGCRNRGCQCQGRSAIKMCPIVLIFWNLRIKRQNLEDDCKSFCDLLRKL